MRKHATVARGLPARQLYSVPAGAEEGRDAVCLAEAYPQAQPPATARPIGRQGRVPARCNRAELKLAKLARRPAMGLIAEASPGKAERRPGRNRP
jgi:hypothetical protein